MKNLFLIFVLALLSIFYTNAQTPELWGMTSEGGIDNVGVIFKTDGSGGNQTVVHSFKKKYTGFEITGPLIQATNGKFYGMLYSGGINDKGVIFEYDPTTNTYTKKLDFDGINNGARPMGSLIQAANGKLYGTTCYGGSHNMGVIFEYDITTDTYTKKFDFNFAYGSYPIGSLIQATNGKFYGMTSAYGTNNMGGIFEYDPITDIYTIKYNFNATIGSYPKGSLIQATNGKLYGITSYDGANEFGGIFEYDIITDTCIKKFDFDGANSGCNANGPLIQATNGKLYGTTRDGGANGKGVFFEYDITTDTFTKKFDFDSTNGFSSYSSLIQATNGKLYGMTTVGGTNGAGIIFEYDITTDTYTNKFDFEENNGSFPYCSLMQATNEKLYGMTYFGGANDKGVIFEYDLTTDIYTKMFDFGGAYNGSTPYGSLMQATNGKLYGMTTVGGIKGNGVIFEYNPTTNNYTKKYEFDGTNGSTPKGSLMQASNGKFYGMTYEGGANNIGVIFEYDITTDNYIKKFDFDSTNGFNPVGSLIQATNDKLYGMTTAGGTNGNGVIFEYDIMTDTYTKKFDFGGVSGYYPTGSLMQATNGKLYGVAYGGGVGNIGVLFEYDPTIDTCIKKYDFDWIYNGHYPVGSLIQATNGKLYGITKYGGGNGEGVLFEYDIALDTCVKKIDFNGTNNGSNPLGSIMQASNGKFYGMTNEGGVNNLGALFECDIVADTCIKKQDFNGINGSHPYYTTLIETNICSFTTSTIDTTVCNTYIAPSGAIYTTPGTYEDRIPNACGADSIITINLTTFDISVTQIGDTLFANQLGANYQWIDCSNNIAINGETNQMFIPTVSGNYAVEITNGTCIDTSACYTVSVGIVANTIFNSVHIYPNPSNGLVDIDFGNLQNVTIKVFNAIGKEILSKRNINDRIYSLNLNQPAGFYIIEVNANNQTKRYKLVIK